MLQLANRLEKWLPRKKADIFGKNNLLKTSLPYYLLTLIPLGYVSLDYLNPYISVVAIYAVFPLLDEIFSLDSQNPTNDERIELEKNDVYFRTTLYTAMIISWAAFFRSMRIFSTMEWNLANLPYLIGTVFVVSNLYSAQFTIAHQLLHRPGKFYKILGTAHMIKLYYMHFTYHHLNRHHRDVATPLDPTTPNKGENIYRFIPRCVVNSFIGVYNDQKQLGKSFFANCAVLSTLGTLAFMALIYFTAGVKFLIAHSIMALGSVIYLESVSYIEHYGLRRKLLPNGEYEKVSILHSWNAPHRFTNYMLFKLQRHSDHHQNSSKPFQTLLSLEESPFLPHGYTLMILMAFFPKTWFKVMDPLLNAYGKLTLQDKGRIDPQIKEKAITETRVFLIEIALVSIVLLLLSCL